MNASKMRQIGFAFVCVSAVCVLIVSNEGLFVFLERVRIPSPQHIKYALINQNDALWLVCVSYASVFMSYVKSMELEKQDKKIFYSEKHRPKLNDKDGDLSKRWEIRFYLYDAKEGKNVLIRNSEMNSYKTVQERRAYARQLMRYFRELQDEGYVRNQPAPTSPHKFLDTLENILNEKKKVLKKNSVRQFITLLNHLRNFVPDGLLVSEFDQAMFQEVKKKIHALELNNRSRNNMLAQMHTVFEYLKDDGYIDENIIKFKKLPTQAHKHKPFTQEQKKQIFDWAKENDEGLFLFVNFMYYTCARPASEIRLLRCCDIFEKTIFINSENSKGNQFAHVPIASPLNKVIDEYKIRQAKPDLYIFGLDGVADMPVNRNYFYHHFVHCLTDLGLAGQGYDLYSLKHSRIIHLLHHAKSFNELRQVQHLARHCSIQQTEDYAKGYGVIFSFNNNDSIINLE